MRNHHTRFFAWAFALATSFSFPAYSAPSFHLPLYYEITEIPALANQGNFATAMNDQQQVVGEYPTDWSWGLGFLYDATTGSLTDLGTLGGIQTSPVGINNAGDIVGFSTTSAHSPHAVLYRNGVLTDLGTLPTGVTSTAADINDAGYIVGSAGLTPVLNGPSIASQFANGTVAPLGAASPGSAPEMVNSSGVAAGWTVEPVSGERRAAIFRNGTVVEIGAAGFNSYGLAINDSGAVVVVQTDLSYITQTTYVDVQGSRVDLGALPGYPVTRGISINNYGLVVGASATSSWASDRAFVYDDCRIVDLNSMLDAASPLKPFVTLTLAYDINNNGWIVANGFDSRDENRFFRAYLLKPIGENSNICT